MVSLIIAFLATTAIYHVFAGPYPSPLKVAHTLPRITTPIHQQLLPEHPIIVHHPINHTRWIRIDYAGQGEIYEKQPILKRYFWRNMIIRHCPDQGCYVKK